MIAKIYDGMNTGGIFVLSEKVLNDDREIEKLFVNLHHEQKKRNSYSNLEISRKREAIETILIPESLTIHKARLTKAGFSHVNVWLRHFNFISLVAIK